MLQREGAEVRVVMTQAAQKFVAPLTFETLSGNEVVREMFPEHRVVKTRHVSWAEWAQAFFICPASANLIGKVASGIADDFLSTLIMAARRPVVFAPAMDYEMVQNPIYLNNVAKLKRFGFHFIDPQEGHLASGAKGPGRLADYATLMDEFDRILNGTQSLAGRHVVVTAGPTREAIDPVRYLSNHSTGLMGFALAQAARHRGARVTLITGPTALPTPAGVRRIDTVNAQDMRDAVLAAWPDCDVLVMAAAVADYRPQSVSLQKLKKGEEDLSVAFTRTPDILAQIAETPGKGFKVGFALESEKGEANALAKLQRKKLDLICLNQAGRPGEGMASETNRVTLLAPDGFKQELPLQGKHETAQAIWDVIESRLTPHADR